MLSCLPKIPRKVKVPEKIHLGSIQKDRQNQEKLVAHVGLKNHSCNVGVLAV